MTCLVWSRDGDESIAAKVLHSSGIDGHQVYDIASGTAAFVAGKDEGLFVNGCDKTCTDTHAGLETDLEILEREWCSTR